MRLLGWPLCCRALDVPTRFPSCHPPFPSRTGSGLLLDSDLFSQFAGSGVACHGLVQFPADAFLHLYFFTPCFLLPASCILLPASYFLCPTSCILLFLESDTSCFLYSTSCILLQCTGENNLDYFITFIYTGIELLFVDSSNQLLRFLKQDFSPKTLFNL